MSAVRILPPICFVLLMAGVSFTTGCNKQTGPPKFPTTGVLTNDGKPVADAQIVFHSTELRVSRGAVTGADGKFTVRAATGSGLPAGTYQVVVRASPIGETRETIVDPRRSDIPQIYWRKKTSPLEKTIVEGENQLNIDLKP